VAQRLIPALREKGAGGEKAKLYPEQARAETLTLLAESQVGCKEPSGNCRPREMIALDRMRLTDPLERNLYF